MFSKPCWCSQDTIERPIGWHAPPGERQFAGALQAPPGERLPRPRGAPEGEPPGAEAHDESVCSLFARRVLDEPASVGPHLLRYRSRLEVSNDTPMLRATSARKHVCKHVCQKRNEAPKDFPTSLSSPTSSLFEMGSTFARGQDRPAQRVF